MANYKTTFNVKLFLTKIGSDTPFLSNLIYQANNYWKRESLIPIASDSTLRLNRALDNG
ncbi:hypothetical protein HZS_8089 [Henneguya salminicola]|nr:hypothetical protein HZS_8089 [Henneguya salminicola]